MEAKCKEAFGEYEAEFEVEAVEDEKGFMWILE